MLTGHTLNGGWKVTSQVPKSPTGTGGWSSVGYVVESPAGKEAFLKALDIFGPFGGTDLTTRLQNLMESYNFERDLCLFCRDRSMGRIVTALDEGTFMVPGAGPYGAVPYLIFERAHGDVRSQVDFSQRFTMSTRFRYLHHVATGLWQLHKQEIAHQDVKPSNVLVFDKKESKLTDLGRAARQGHTPPHHLLEVQGDNSYAPPELLYGDINADWCVRRQGCDLYLFGSLVVYFFAGTAMTPEIIRHLPPTHYPGLWKGTYRDLLPVIEKAYGDSMDGVRQAVDPDLRGDLLPIITQLCDPDPLRRGHPKGRGIKGQQYSLERYVAIFDRLTMKSEILLAKKKVAP